MNEAARVRQILKSTEPSLRILLIRTFKKINIVNQGSVDEEQTVYEFLEYVAGEGNKMKAEWDRRKTGIAEGLEDGVWNIPDLSNHKKQLSEVMVKELLCDDTHELEHSERMKVHDITLICSIILNNYMNIDIPQPVKEAIFKIRAIRNAAYHETNEQDNRWFNICLKEILECMDVFSKYHDLKQYKLPSLLHMEDLKEKVNQNYKPNFPYIDLKYNNITSNTDVHSLEEFVANHKSHSPSKSSTIVLSGISGSGKSIVLSQMAYDLAKSDVFKLVVYVKDSERKEEEEPLKPMDALFAGLRCLASDMFNQNSDEWKEKLKKYMKDILVILDVNTNSPNELILGISEGNWIITTPTDFEAAVWKRDINVLKIKPLDESQIKNLLNKFNPDGREYDNIVKQYDNCTYKWGLDTPEAVAIFSSLKENAAVKLEISFIQCLFEKKMRPLKGKEKLVISKLGEQACKVISLKAKYVNDSFKCEEEIIQAFLITVKKGTDTKVIGRRFCHTLLRDFLCAKYFIKNPSQAFIVYKGAPFLYKRAFKIACYLAESANIFDEFVEHIEKFLSCFFMSLRNDEEKNTGVLESLDYIFDIIEACQREEAQMTIAKFIAEFLDSYNSWHVDCSDLRKENIQSLCSLIKNMKVTRKKLITLVLFTDFSSYTSATVLWNALKSLEAHPFSIRVKFNSVCKEPPYMKYMDNTDERNLREFCQNITEICPPSLSVEEYKGPILLSKTFEPFGNESPLKGLVILEVHVFDIFSLNRLLSCNKLESLRTLDITFKMHNSVDDIESVGHSLPNQNNKLRFSLNVINYRGIQKLLNKVNDIECLTSLGILDITTEDLSENDGIDLRYFKTLNTLELRARMSDMRKDVPIVFARVVHRDTCTENTCHMEQNNSEKSVAMDVNTDDTVPMDQEDGSVNRRDAWEVTFSCSSNQQDASPSQANTLTVLLPEKLYCLILNGFRIDLDFLDSLDENRVIITAANVRVSDISAFLRRISEDQVEPMKLQKVYGVIKKKKRFSKEEREKLKKQPQPRGREIIITQEENVDEDLSHFVKVEFHHVIRALHQYEGSFFSYKSDQITLRKDVCEDIRICLPVELLEDNLILKHCDDPLGEGENLEFMRDLYRTLSLVHFITIEETSLSHIGTCSFLKKLIETKKEMTEGGEVDPFHLSVMMNECVVQDNIVGSKLHAFVRDSRELAKFSLSCKHKQCPCHFRRTVDGDFWINGRKL